MEPGSSEEKQATVNSFVSNLSLLPLIDRTLSHSSLAFFTIVINSGLDLILDRSAVLVDTRVRVARSVDDVEVQTEV